MEIIEDKAVRRKYAIDWWAVSHKWSEEEIQKHLPTAIAIPKNVEEVQTAVKYANEHGLKVIPYGGGSGVLGGIIPIKPTLTIDMRQITGVVDFDEDDHLVTVNAGMIGSELEDYLNKRGYTIGHYPQSLYLASIGGLVATKSAGTFSSKYGNIENVMQALEVVLPNGEILSNRNIPRSSTGPHIPTLFIGSEGTLGIITKVTLRMSKLPERREFRGIEFSSWEDAIYTAREFYRRDIVPAVIRINNPAESQNFFSKINHKASEGKVLMIIGIVGAETVVPEVLKQVLLTAKERGGEDIGPEIGNIWEKTRYNADWMKAGNSGNYIGDAIEVSGNWTQLPKMLALVSKRLEGKVAMLWAHGSHFYASGGNIYFIVVAKGENNQDVLAKYDDIWNTIMKAVYEIGGSGAHHHGIGKQRLPWYEEEIGHESHEILAGLEEVIDPKHTFSPGNLGVKK
ncbi:FAD-binding oxidoreductase [Lactobacillus sp. ESL0791]|uniref:FAD-binding oxidoreductase n=1 Tax=Lactobacillus sp. ESL0791 TaxID=2983234 RepID=UPI0023F8F37A|nr:FAD-binding oxidoreductase [Lactobacillus sp. ESL0791]MDF7638078.1 FAD-binding oxidoreductase [Lactobacillus sp. ESL0791]